MAAYVTKKDKMTSLPENEHLESDISKDAVPRALDKTRICPACGKGLLGWDKRPFTSGNGFIYRERLCNACDRIVHTKQGPELVTGISCKDARTPQ